MEKQRINCLYLVYVITFKACLWLLFYAVLLAKISYGLSVSHYHRHIYVGIYAVFFISALNFGLNDSLEVKQSLLAPGYFDKIAQTTSFDSKNISQCISGKSWSWPIRNDLYLAKEQIHFDVLMPIKSHSRQIIPDENNFSCILLIRWRDKGILLAGDIEKSAELLFLQHYKLPPLTLLVAPHHGSKTSSSRPFIGMLKPQHVVFSAGYRHHFGHPHKDVVDRYKTLGSTLWNTASSGSISFEWDINGDLNIVTARKGKAVYWWH